MILYLNMAYILQIETSTTTCSVALSLNGGSIAFKELQERNIHASSITVFIQDVLDEAGIRFNQLDAVAVAKGPGSYTGLRIGVSTAKGLCYALDIPLIAINTLDMMVAGFLSENPTFKGFVVPMLDARRMEVYTGIWNSEGLTVEETSAKIIDNTFLAEKLGNTDIAFIGDGSAKFAEILQHPNAAFYLNNDYNSARNLSKLAYKSFKDQKFEDVAYFEPFYLKDFMVTQPKAKKL